MEFIDWIPAKAQMPSPNPGADSGWANAASWGRLAGGVWVLSLGGEDEPRTPCHSQRMPWHQLPWFVSPFGHGEGLSFGSARYLAVRSASTAGVRAENPLLRKVSNSRVPYVGEKNKKLYLSDKMQNYF